MSKGLEHGEAGRQKEPAFQLATRTRLRGAALTPGDNERLEHLGDAVLGLVVAEELYRRRPDWSEADLAQGREQVVNGRALAAAGRRAGLDREIRGKAPPEGWPDGVVADVVEALVAAAYLEGGLDAARAFVLGLLAVEIRDVLAGRVRQHPKNVLQGFAERKWGQRPVYEVVTRPGEGARVRVRIGGLTAEGAGRTRREAEASAAEALLRVMEASKAEPGVGRAD